MKKSKSKVLMVDDDPNLLAAFQRRFRTKYDVDVAERGSTGLRILADHGPFAVVVSDMRMPEMNGIQFLRKVAAEHPETVRIMLTGNTDLDTAIHAVNNSNIFRFLVKPCKKETLEWAIDSGIDQYRLIKAEKVLLNKTLKGSIEVLTEVLSLVNPIAFSRTSRIQNYVRQLVAHLRLAQSWQYELAALLSQIGCIGVPEDVLVRFYKRESLSKQEQEQIDNHPALARELLEKIPRLGQVAHIIANQKLTFAELGLPGHTLPNDIETVGGLILRAVVDFDTSLSQGRGKETAIEDLNLHRARYHPLIVKALEHVHVLATGEQSGPVRVRDLEVGMTLAEDIRTSAGTLIAAKGQQVTASMSTLLQSYLEREQISETIRVVLETRAEENQDALTAESSALI